MFETIKNKRLRLAIAFSLIITITWLWLIVDVDFSPAASEKPISQAEKSQPAQAVNYNRLISVKQMLANLKEIPASSKKK